VRRRAASIAQWLFLDTRRALASSQGKLQVWDVEKFEPIETLPVEGTTFQLSDDRRTLVVPHRGAVQVYRVSFD
jgi:hypothetical protein